MSVEETGLIERLQNAEGGSRELSDAVLEAAGWTLSANLGPQRMYTPPDASTTMYQAYAPSPTESLDDALTLAPENVLSWKISDTPGGPHAWLYDGEREYDGYPNPGCGTPALALCIAALKAKGGRE